jgi:hypothetical protein
MPAGRRRDGGASKRSVTGRGGSLTASVCVSSVGRHETWRCQGDLGDVPRANRAASIPPRQKLQEVYRQFTYALQNACGFAKNETVLTPRMRPSSTRDDAVTLTLAPMLWSPLENTRAASGPPALSCLTQYGSVLQVPLESQVAYHRTQVYSCPISCVFFCSSAASEYVKA